MVENIRQGPDHTSPPAAVATGFLHSHQLVKPTFNNLGYNSHMAVKAERTNN